MDDKLAITATAPASASGSTPIGPKLGRFQIESILGTGGMGVVHAAFDPELERKVALKVLHKADNADARARLLREARAMAKLSDPHVINVFEVGSVDGRDFVAMELVDGGTLGDWLRRTQRTPDEILPAFLAAGRGLAAAHAAGLIHRDFKPTNVLRSTTGKIVVTDFGLARSIDDPSAAVTAAGGDAKVVTHTETGALLGTPAYMAPEQWTGGAITPATDQFAFCVALWEALVGDRPFQGTTIDQLRAAILESEPMGGETIPRALRPILRRGLARDPALRWPSMDALLTALARTQRRRAWWLAAIAAAVLGAAVAAYAFVPAAGVSSPDACARELDETWSTAGIVELAARAPSAAALLERDVAAWRGAMARTCAGPPEQRSARLACLDAVLARIEDARHATLVSEPPLASDMLAFELVDPAMCERPTPARVASLTPELSALFAFERDPEGKRAPVLAAQANDPCAQIIRRHAETRNPFSILDYTALLRVGKSQLALLERCADDKLHATVLLWIALGSNDVAAAQTAVERYPEAGLRAELELLRADLAEKLQLGPPDAYERALALYGERGRRRDQLDVVAKLARVLRASRRPQDVAAFDQLLARWLPLATGEQRRALEIEAARQRWNRGDIHAADRELARLGVATEITFEMGFGEMTAVEGIVVDERGAPIEGALVHSGFPLVGDAALAGVPHLTHHYRSARTDHDGAFKLYAARGAIVAQFAERRSRAVAVAPRVRLVLAPTSRVAGRVQHLPADPTRLWVVAGEHATSGPFVVGPIGMDGSFELVGVPRTEILVGTVTDELAAAGGRAKRLAVRDSRHDGLVLSPNPSLFVIARSNDLTPPEAVWLWMDTQFDPGKKPTLYELQAIVRHTVRQASAHELGAATVPPALASIARPTDLVARFPDRPAGTLTVCAVAFSRRQFAALRGMVSVGTAMGTQPFTCSDVEPDNNVAVVQLPPLQRFDDTPTTPPPRSPRTLEPDGSRVLPRP